MQLFKQYKVVGKSDCEIELLALTAIPFVLEPSVGFSNEFLPIV